MDIFGAEKTAHSGKDIVSSTGVLVDFNGTIALAQSANVTYQRTVQPVYELGKEDIYVVIPGATGTCNVSRAVSKSAKAFQYVPKDANCDTSGTMMLQKGQGKCTAEPGTVKCTGVIVQNVSLQVQAGQGFLTETMDAFVSCVEGG